MIGTVLVAAIYNNTTSLGNAYGVCVMFVTFFDTCMVSLAAMFVWRISPFIVFFPWVTISLVKVPDGAWFTLTLSGILASLFILWRFGKEQQWAAEAVDRFPTTHFVNQQQDGSLRLNNAYGGASISSVKGFGIFFDKDGTTVPPVFSQFIIKLAAAPEVMVLFHLRPLEVPYVPPQERYNVSRLAVPNCYRLVVRHGYSDEVINPDLAHLIYDQVRAFIIRDNETPPPVNGAGVSGCDKSEQVEKENALGATSATDVEKTPQHSTSEESSGHAPRIIFRNIAQTNPVSVPPQNTSFTLAKLEEAYNHQVIYIIGKSQLKVASGCGIFRQMLLHAWLWIRENTRTKIGSLKVPMDRVFEIGFVKDI